MIKSVQGLMDAASGGEVLNSPTAAEVCVQLSNAIHVDSSTLLSPVDVVTVTTAAEAASLLAHREEPKKLAWLYVLVPILPGGFVNPLIKIGCHHSTVINTFSLLFAFHFELNRVEHERSG